nr:hypothetical protein [Tanacetum cinerariifolium]
RAHCAGLLVNERIPCRTEDVLGRGLYALSWKPCQEDSLNLPDHSLIPVESDSTPHAHAQTTKTY